MNPSSDKFFPAAMEDIFDRITDAIVALDNDWCYTYMNKKAGEIFNRNPTKMIGRHIWTEFPEAIDQIFYKAYHKAMATQQYIHVEEYYPPYDKWFENHIYPSPEGLSILFRDITEQKEIEQLLQESKEKFATIFKAAPGSIILSSLPDGRMVEVNDNFSLITGYSSKEAIGKTTADLNLWTDPSERKRFLSLLEVSGVVKDFEADLNHKSGAILRGIISGHVISISEKKYVFGIFYDITERRKLEEKQSLFSTIVNSTDDGVLSKNLEGIITSWNPGAEKLFGYSLEEIAGKHISILTAGHHSNEEKEITELIKRGSSLVHYETERTRKDGTNIQVCLTISPLKDLMGNTVGATEISRDITETKKLEDLLDKTNRLARIGTWEANLETGKVYWSPVTCEIHETDVDYEPTLSKCIDFYKEGQNRETIIKCVQACINNGTAWDEELQIVTLKGNVKWIRTISQGEFRDGKCIRFYGSFQDIDEKKKAEQKLRESEEFNRTILESSLDCIKMMDNKGRLQFINSNGCKLLEVDDFCDVKNRYWWDMWGEDNKQIVKESLKKSLAGGTAHFEAFCATAKGNPKWWDVVVSPVAKTALGTQQIISVSRDITEKKNLEDLLDKSNRLAKIGNWEANLVEGTAYWSAVTKEIHETAPDYVPDFAQGLGFFLEGKNRDQITQCVQACIEDGTAWDQELQIVTAKGNLKWVRTIGNAAFKDGKCTRFYGSFQDIDERKKAEQELAQSENHLRTILQTEPECIKLLGPKGELLDMNPAGLAMLEADSLDQLLGHNVAELLMPEYKTAFAQLTNEVFKGNTGKLEFEIKGLKGTDRWLETNAVPLKDADGKIISLLGVTRDITESKKAEQALIESEEKYRSLIQNSPDIIMQLDLEEKVQFINFTEAGFNKEQVIGISAYEFVMSEFHEVVREAHKKVVETQQSQTYETVGLGLDGVKRWFFTNAGPIVINDKVTGITLITRDISERKKAEEEILSTTAQLRLLAAHLQNIREEERKRIGREIHDDLGQQLTAIKMDVAWIDKKTTDEFSLIKPKLKNIITLLDGSNESVRKILNELRAGVLDSYGLVDALEWQGKQFTLNTGIPLLFSSNKAGIPTDEAITTCIYRVFQESLTNITKYANAKKVTSSLTYSDEKILLEIKDNGVGFDIMMLKSNQSFGILGMKERVASLSGHFELLSLPGKGTTIKISLPLNK